MDLVLGVDAGATKTLAAVADLAGRIRGWGRAGCGNFQVNGPRAAREVSRAIRRALVMAEAEHSRVIAAYYGMAGADRPSDFAYIHSFLDPINPAPRWEVENDATIALVAATGRRLAVVVVCLLLQSLREEPGRPRCLLLPRRGRTHAPPPGGLIDRCEGDGA